MTTKKELLENERLFDDLIQQFSAILDKTDIDVMYYPSVFLDCAMYWYRKETNGDLQALLGLIGCLVHMPNHWNELEKIEDHGFTVIDGGKK